MLQKSSRMVEGSAPRILVQSDIVIVFPDFFLGV